MQSNTVTTELWDLQKPTITSRSRLFHLEPIGIGTLLVESLMGYVTRLADYHCVTPRQLVFKEIAPLIRKKGYPSIGFSKKIDRLFTSSSPLIKGNEVKGLMAETFLKVLGELTLRGDLWQLSLLRQSSTFFTGGQLRNHQAWCPTCLEEWRLAKRIIYTPLIWLLKDLWLCPQHKTQELIYCCPYCQQSFPPLSATLRPGFCPKCREWLGSNSKDSPNKHSKYGDIGLDAFMTDPIKHQLIWVDDSEKRLEELKEPFYPPKLSWLYHLNPDSIETTGALSKV